MAGAGERRVVLVADDDVVLRNLIRQTLESAGFDVLSAANGLEALVLSREFKGHIHALLTDFNMPDLDGRGLILALQQDRPETPCIIMSGGHSATEFADLNVTIVTKPFVMPDLVRVIERAISSRPESRPGARSM